MFKYMLNILVYLTYFGVHTDNLICHIKIYFVKSYYNIHVSIIIL